jgi:hypothetical protein
MASRRNGTLYAGVTSDIVKRVWQHKNGEAAALQNVIPFTPWCGMKFMTLWNLPFNGRKR